MAPTFEFAQVPGEDRQGFSISLDLRYRMLDGHKGEIGTGRTIHISSSRVLFTTDRALDVDDRLELSIDWPAQIDNRPMKLVAMGRVVFAASGKAAVTIDRHEFRTQGTNGLAPRG